MMNIKKPLITRIVGNRHACSLLIAIVFLSAETSYAVSGSSTLRPVLQFSEMGREVIKRGRGGLDTPKNKEHLFFHARIINHEAVNIIDGIISFFDVSIKKPAERTKSELFTDKVTAMRLASRMPALLERLEQTPELGYEDNAKEIVALLTSILKELEELKFPDLTLNGVKLREQLNTKRQMYEFAKRIIRNFIKTNGSFDFVGTPSITNIANSLSEPSKYFGRKGRFSVILSISQGLSPVIIDPDLLMGVWMNLLRNALEANATKIVINGENKDGMIVVYVKDNGNGIDPKDAGHIFEPFWTKGKSTGTGLGLYICQEVIKKAGGTIKVTSELGKGTTFTIRLPVAQDTQLGLTNNLVREAPRHCL